MASGSIKGITIELNGDTTGLGKALHSVSTESVSLSKDLKTVNQLLKLDPGNSELVAQKQQILAQSIAATSEKLEILRAAQEQVKAQFENGEISREQYIAFQKELVNTEQRMQSLTNEQTEMQNGLDESADSADETASSVKNLGKEEDTASGKTGQLGEKLKNGLAAGAKAAAAALDAATAAVTATVGGIIKATASTAEYGDNIDDMSQKLGMSAEKYQEWGFILEHNDANIDSMTSSMKKLSDAVVDQSKSSVAAFEKIGISMEEAGKMSQEELFAATVKGLQGMESGAERTAIATDLLGKGAMELGGLLNMSAEETEAMRQQVHKLGGVMSDEAVAAASDYQDTLQDMKVAMGGTVRSIAGSFMPAVTDIMKGFTAIISGDSSGAALLADGLKAFVQNIDGLIPELTKTAAEIIPTVIAALTASLPMLLDCAKDILVMLADGVLDAMPVLLSVAGDIILQLADALIAMLPQLTDTGLKVIAQLAIGIAQALPTLIPTITDVMLQIVETLIDNIDLLVDASIQIIIALANGLINAVPRLIAKAPEIIEKLVQALIRNAPKLLTSAAEIIVVLAKGLIQSLPKLLAAGVEIVGSIASGIVSAIGKVVSAAGRIVSGIWDTIKGLPGKALQWGRDLIEGMVSGIKKAKDKVVGAVKGVGEKIKSFLHFSRPDEGPLRDYETWMPDMMKGLAKGIRSNMQYVEREVAALAGAMVPDVSLNMAPYRSGTLADAASGGSFGTSAGGGSVTNNFTISIDVRQISSDYDARKLADVIAEEISRLTRDNGSLKGAVVA